ncbi:MAG TPA: hypothetical protein VGG34_02075 [Opitutaceae bacterium]
MSEFVRAKYSVLYPKSRSALLPRLFNDVDDLFCGRTPAYAPIDLKYHDLRHTLMATVCMTLLLEGQHASEGESHLKARDYELAIAGVLLHDAGYLKLKSDTEGTGAKYTFCHILRSCAFAASYLPETGATDVEIESVLSAIDCTGPHSEISRLKFRDPVSRIVGCSLATADYMGQLADPLYPDKLGELYAEFRESDDFANVPMEKRMFKSEEDLVCRSPGFWTSFVKPKLEIDFQGVYRFLDRPLRSGRNGYMDAVDANFARIERRIAEIRSARV